MRSPVFELVDGSPSTSGRLHLSIYLSQSDALEGLSTTPVRHHLPLPNSRQRKSSSATSSLRFNPSYSLAAAPEVPSLANHPSPHPPTPPSPTASSPCHHPLTARSAPSPLAALAFDTVPTNLPGWHLVLDAIPERWRARLNVMGNYTKHMLSGALSAAVSKSVTSPLERVRLELVLHSRQEGAFRVAVGILREQGLLGFWKGNMLNIARTAPFKVGY